MNLFELIRFFGEQRVYLCKTEDQIQYQSPVKFPSDILNFFKEKKQLFTQALNLFEKQFVTICPLSYNQQSLWFTYLLSPKSKAYNVALPLRFNSPIKTEHIKKVIGSLVKKHHQLRAVFNFISDENESIPCQFITHDDTIRFNFSDFRSLEACKVQNSIINFYQQPFELSVETPFRAGLFTLDGNESLLLFVFHHIICDAKSLGIFFSDFLSLYSDTNTQQNQIPTPYTDFITHQFSYVNDHKHSAITYWKDKFNCNRGNLLKTDYIRKQIKNYNGDSIYFNIDIEIAKNINHIAKSLSITPFSLYFGVFQILYMYYSESCNATIGILSPGRTSHAFSKTTGYFVNPIPLFCNRSENTLISEHLKCTHKEICEALDYQFFPFSLLVEQLSPERKPGQQVLFSALFNMLSKKQLGPACNFIYPDSNSVQENFGDLSLKPYHLNQQEGQFDITLELIERDELIQGILKYDTDLFSSDTANRMVSQYSNLLTEAAHLIDQPVTSVFNLLKESGKPLIADRSLGLSVASTFTANILEDSFRYWQNLTGMKLEYKFSPYYQIEQYLSHTSLYNCEAIQYHIILLRIEDLAYHTENSSGINLQNIQKRASDICDLLINTSAKFKSRFLLFFCPCSTIVSSDKTISDNLLYIENQMISSLSAAESFYCISSDQILQTFNCEEHYEPSVGIIGQVPYTRQFYEVLGKMIIRSIYAFEKPPCKAIIVDCDNTLWLGVAGEDSIEQITIPQPFKAFQSFLKNCAERGILILLCSKNNREDTVNVFNNHPDMILSPNDISFDRINWNPKSQNISELLADANLSSSGVIFIDDNPGECAEVKSSYPEIHVICLPQNLSERINYINNFWAFDKPVVTNQDRLRTQNYRIEQKRKELRLKTSTYADFIENLNLQITIKKPSLDDVPRISQLSYRTNQFTTGSPRLTESDVANVINHDDLFVINVQDRFGDYGLVGVMVAHSGSESYNITNFFLSCRSLGRGVEHRCLSFAGARAEQLNLKTVTIRVYNTQKNKPLQSFFANNFHAYQTILENSYIYTIPADVCKQTVFDPSEYELKIQTVSQFDNNIVTENNGISFSTEILHTIASKLSSTPLLHQHMQIFRSNGSTSFNLKENIEITPVKNGNSSSMEEIIKQIWIDCLGIDTPDNDQNFFDAGGKSMLLPHIVQKIFQLTKKSVSLVDLFQYPTISSLSSFLNSKTEDQVEI